MNSSHAQVFVAWSLPHVMALGATAVICLTAFFGCRRHNKRPYIEWIRWSLAACFISGLLWGMVRRAMAPDYRWVEIIQIHLCDISLMMAAAALILLRRFPFEFAYYFGVGGTLQALLTPDLGRTFPAPEYFAFFLGHGAILVGVAFLAGAYGLKPGPGAVVRMIVAGNAYMIFAGIYNYFTKSNYGYLCGKPPHPSLLDRLGPWPWYLIWMELLAILTILLLHLPVVIAQKRCHTER